MHWAFKQRHIDDPDSVAAVSGVSDTKLILALYSDNEAVVKTAKVTVRLPIGLQPRN